MKLIIIIVNIGVIVWGSYAIGYDMATKEVKKQFLEGEIECEVVDYTSKDGFFTAVRLGTIAKGAVQKLD